MGIDDSYRQLPQSGYFIEWAALQQRGHIWTIKMFSKIVVLDSPPIDPVYLCVMGS